MASEGAPRSVEVADAAPGVQWFKEELSQN